MAKRRSKAEYDQIKPVAFRMLAEGKSVAAVAAEFALSENTVNTWWWAVKTYAAISVLDNKEELGESLAKYLRTNLDSLRNQAGFLGEREFLEKNGPNIFGIAQSHRILAAEAIRLVKAVTERPEERDNEQSPD